MENKTHLIIGLFIALYFLPHINYKIVFFPIVLIASIIPNLDTLIFPKKDYKIFRSIKSESYKNFMHSYTLCIFLSLILAFFYPLVALPFFIGYSFHLFFDGITKKGINPFWPFKIKTKGFISPGGTSEKTIVVIFIFLSLLLILKYLF